MNHLPVVCLLAFVLLLLVGPNRGSAEQLPVVSPAATYRESRDKALQRVAAHLPLKTGNAWVYQVSSCRDVGAYGVVANKSGSLDAGVLVTSTDGIWKTVKTIEYTVAGPTDDSPEFWEIRVHSAEGNPYGTAALRWGPIIVSVAFTSDSRFLYFVERLITQGQRVGDPKPTRLELDSILLAGEATGITGVFEIKTAVVTNPLTLPAGTFNNVLISAVKVVGSSYPPENVTIESYFAPSVGLVKRIWKDHVGETSCTLELLRYQLAK